MANKKQVVLIVMALLIVLGGLFALYLNNEIHNRRGLNISTTPPVKTVSLMSAQWTTYHNQAYNYRIDYPSNLSVISPPSGPESIGFAPADSPWQMVIAIRLQFHTLEEWIKASNEASRQYAYLRENETPEDSKLPGVIIERDIIISGKYQGIIASFPHTKEPSLKSAVFIKHGVLFEISIRNPNIDHEHVWNSFKFEE